MQLAEPDTRQTLLRMYEAKRERFKRRSIDSFVHFASNPVLFNEVPAAHHWYICSVLEMVAAGDLKRLIIVAPPGSAKSTYTSERFAAWYFGHNPKAMVIAASHTKSLAQRWGRRVRNLVNNEQYQFIFEGTRLDEGLQAQAEWGTTEGGEYYAVGFDGSIAGRRADLILIDDPIKGIEDAESETVREKVWDVFTSDLRPRVRKDAAMVIISTRWHEDDLVGRILPEGWEGGSGWVTSRYGEKWYVVHIAMEAEQGDILGRSPGERLWPAWFTQEWLAQEKIAQGRRWAPLFQGRPSSDEGAIIKAGWWRKWPLKKLPVCDFVLQTYDTAYEKGEEDDYSARTSWGIFDILQQDNAELLKMLLTGPDGKPIKRKELQRYHAILLEAWRGKVEYPELKKEIRRSAGDLEPDRIIIERKSSGISLLQELKRSKLKVKGWKVDKDKRARGSAASDAWAQGAVWYYDSPEARLVIKECAGFPATRYDDWYDTVTMAGNYLRQHYHLHLIEDDWDEPEESPLPPKPPEPIYG